MDQKYLYKRTLIVTEVTAIARSDADSIHEFRFNIVGHIPTDRNLIRIAQRKEPESEILSIAKTEPKRKLFGITPEAFIEAADELDPQSGKIIKRR